MICAAPRDAFEGKFLRDALEGGEVPPPPTPSRAPSLCPRTVPLTANANFNGIYRQ